MPAHYAEVEWTLQNHSQQPNTYNRDHTVTFENGQRINNSAAPAFLGNTTMANPETMLLAALASCHMLTFLAMASKRGFQVSYYQDKAEATLAKNADGRMAISHCVLKPSIQFIGDTSPTPEELSKLHESAHRHCFIANSLNATIEILS
jgi:organic hydroperoxide reductase OsmC/OhrA